VVPLWLRRLATERSAATNCMRRATAKQSFVVRPETLLAFQGLGALRWKPSGNRLTRSLAMPSPRNRCGQREKSCFYRVPPLETWHARANHRSIEIFGAGRSESKPSTSMLHWNCGS